MNRISTLKSLIKVGTCSNLVGCLILGSLAASEANAASCCGGSANFPHLITTPTLTQLNTSFSYTDLDSRYDRLNRIRRDLRSDQQDRTLTLQVGLSHQWTDYWQAGLIAPLIYRNVTMSASNASEMNLGDVSFFLSHEYWPEFERNFWKPRGFLSLQWTLPTGISFEESDSSLATDVNGTGQHQVALTHFWMKTAIPWDFFWTTQARLLIATTLADQFQVPHRFAGSTEVGIGFSPRGGAWRLGLSLAPHYEAAYFSQTPFQKTETPARLLWNAGVQLSYLVSPELSLNLSYSDETLIQWASTSPALSKTVSINLIQRWLM